MNDPVLQTRDEIAATYLQQLQELAFEISAATDAIAANALAKFQQSVARQEMLCSSLASMANTVSEGFCSSRQPLLSGIDPTVETRIRAASGVLHELNLQYATLLKHSGKSIAVLASLCRTHTGKFQEARGPRLKHQTWSCEM
jgi:hypothetical protein